MKGSFRVAPCALILGALLQTSVSAQQVTPQAGRQGQQGPQVFPTPPLEFGYHGGDPLGGAFFSPEVVMRYQQQIGLTAEQRTAIVAAISAAQPRFVEAQWQLEPETAALGQLLQGARVDEAAVLQQIDRVLDIERQIKRIQIEMLLRIKNQLTEEQQTQLARLGGTRGLRGFGTPGAYELDKMIHGQGADAWLLEDPLDGWLNKAPFGYYPKVVPPGVW
jgi:Spy/CpxP family protein refolding chaperone